MDNQEYNKLIQLKNNLLEYFLLINYNTFVDISIKRFIDKYFVVVVNNIINIDNDYILKSLVLSTPNQEMVEKYVSQSLNIKHWGYTFKNYLEDIQEGLIKNEEVLPGSHFYLLHQPKIDLGGNYNLYPKYYENK